jgi:dynein heavy chain
LDDFKGIDDHLVNNPDDFKEIFDAPNANEIPLPAPWEEKLNGFQKMIVLKAIRPDKLIPSV